jgi:excisionase family DNA binding protein
MQNVLQLYDVKRVAQQLSLSPWTIRAYIRSGKLRPVRIGRLVRLDEKEIADFVANSKKGLMTVPQIPTKVGPNE